MYENVTVTSRSRPNAFGRFRSGEVDLAAAAAAQKAARATVKEKCPKCECLKAKGDRRFLILEGGSRFHFPKRQPKTLTFRIRDKDKDDQYARLYSDKVVDTVRVLHLPRYGLEVGCDASFVLLQARDPVEAIRLRATRLQVFRRGVLLAETPPATARLHLDGRPARSDWTHAPR